MYATHCPAIAAAMREDIGTFKRGLFFVVCSIRQATVNVPDQVQEVERYGAGAECAWGFKRAAIQHIEENAAALHSAVIRARTLSDALEVLLTVPGLGIVKSAFVLQLMGRNIACLDSRNVKRDGRNPRAFRTDGRPPHALRGKIKRYVRETRGKARHYWDTWCEDVARAYGMTPEEVSALHLCILQPVQYDLEDTF